MVTLETARIAAAADQPWLRLDELVRAELAAGRTVADLAEEFRTLYADVTATPGLSEDGVDAFGDTMDSLTGNCQSQYRYEDVPVAKWPETKASVRCV